MKASGKTWHLQINAQNYNEGIVMKASRRNKLVETIDGQVTVCFDDLFWSTQNSFLKDNWNYFT